MNIDLNVVEKRCLDPIEAFFEEGSVYDTKNGVYIYKDNGSDVLAVAHLDSVNYLKHFVTTEWNGLNIVFTSQVDDRIGAYTILDLLPSLGVVTDILLTEGEEIGHSTASFFDPPPGKEYNWMFSFDREGVDVVMYEYGNLLSDELLEDFGFEVGWGSFSDICYLNHLKCIGFNFGTGYYDSHDRTAHFAVEHLKSQVEKFAKFFEEQKDNFMSFDPLDPIFTRANRMYVPYYGAWDADALYYWGNEKFGAGKSTTPGIYRYNVLCPECGKHTMNTTPSYEYCSLCGYYKMKRGEQLDLLPPKTTKVKGISSSTNYDWCDYCKGQTEDVNLTYVEGAGYICAPCLITYFARCTWCNSFFEKQSGGGMIRSEPVCYECYNDYLQWIEDEEISNERNYDAGKPHCLTCRDDNQNLIELEYEGGISKKEWRCPVCNGIFIVDE